MVAVYEPGATFTVNWQAVPANVKLQPGDAGVKPSVVLRFVGPAIAIASDCVEGETKPGTLPACFFAFGTRMRKTALPVRSPSRAGVEAGSELPPPQPAATSAVHEIAKARMNRMAPTYGRIASETGAARPLVNVANGAPV